MYIKQVIIDGFKSYANRTVVPDFDPQFNAITGLNGSGKSNILDAICFVLGITQLSQVRVANLQGLVYKQGQSGVTKASVTIVFDNSDAAASPPGYQGQKEITVTRQVAIGGRNKYLINGKNAQAKTVQEMFHSVQLNVNNPHFLIMQGRITKVLNMKPPEILGMIEEAAGTRLFEKKRQEAETKIQHKQAKVEEIEKILSEEITPKLEKLRNERESYLKWASQNREAETLLRFVTAHEYVEHETIVREGDSRKEKLREQLSAISEESELGKRSIAKAKADRVEKTGTELEQLQEEVGSRQKQVEELSKGSAKQKRVVQLQKQALKKLHDSQKTLMAKRESFEGEYEALQSKSTSMATELEEAETEFNHAKAEVDRAKSGVQAAAAGLASDATRPDGQQVTLKEKAVGLRTEANEAATSIKQNQMRIQHMEKELSAVSKRVDSMGKNGDKAQSELEEHKATVAGLQLQIQELGYNPAEVNATQDQVDELHARLQAVRDREEELSARLAAFEFEFASPSKGFDRSKVKGLVAKLVNVFDPDHATALEVVAGGKLYQVVVDTVQTGKELLQKGKLKKRVTIIPLDSVSARTIPAAKLDAAAQIANQRGGSASSALTLVGYDEEVHRAMEYVFGTTLVCDTFETAQAVTFDKKVRIKSVTLEGDAFDPQGTLSGGSRSKRGSVLAELSKLHTVQSQADGLSKMLDQLSSKLSEWKKLSATYESLHRDLEKAKKKLEFVQARVDTTPFAQELAKQEELRSSIEAAQARIIELEELRAQATIGAEHLEQEMTNMEEARSKLVESAQSVLLAAQEELAKAAAHVDSVRAMAEQASQAVADLVAENQGVEEDLSGIAKEITSATEALAELESQLAGNSSEELAAREQLEVAKTLLQDCTQELAQLDSAIERYSALVTRNELRIKEIEGEINLSDKSSSKAVDRLKALRAGHPWIATEREYFGKPQSAYDFDAMCPKAARTRLGKLQASQADMSRNINKKVMGMIDKVEKEYQSLHEKRTIIEKDRATIERVIKSLDAKKNDALRTTWEKVNKDFGSIFSTLLPGTQAKLDPPEDGTILDGLEVKVAFGQTWKKSLSELSGGQRSLLALSLILSLLLFKPAPMYILDEVDAALDLSHTQNIGQMLRTHFAHSQFIVVSLKEGMFNNANVIFRTKFIDGLSTVTRHSNRENLRRALADGKVHDAKGQKKRTRNNENVPANS